MEKDELNCVQNQQRNRFEVHYQNVQYNEQRRAEVALLVVELLKLKQLFNCNVRLAELDRQDQKDRNQDNRAQQLDVQPENVAKACLPLFALKH